MGCSLSSGSQNTCLIVSADVPFPVEFLLSVTLETLSAGMADPDAISSIICENFNDEETYII